jgi:hypothetical protein
LLARLQSTLWIEHEAAGSETNCIQGVWVTPIKERACREWSNLMLIGYYLLTSLICGVI